MNESRRIESNSACEQSESRVNSTVVFGGSFNPLHIGHLAILRALCERDDVARVLLVVSPKNPLKDNISADSAAARLQAARQTLVRHPELGGKVKVCDIEFRLSPPNYTIRTLDALRDVTPGHPLALAIGGDQLADFRRWKDYARILLEYGLLVYPREGFDSATLRDAGVPEARIGMLQGKAREAEARQPAARIRQFALFQGQVRVDAGHAHGTH